MNGEIYDPIRQQYPTTYALMQYTGLKDRNGVEIYEGDIVRGDGLRGTGEVVWNAWHGRWDVAKTSQWLQADDDARDGLFVKAEVIGNAYENPELQS